jgi:hypothetical protein
MTYRVAVEKPRKSSGKGPIVEPKPGKLTSMGLDASSISMTSGTA